MGAVTPETCRGTVQWIKCLHTVASSWTFLLTKKTDVYRLSSGPHLKNIRGERSKSEAPVHAMKVNRGSSGTAKSILNLLKPTGHVMHHQFNIQQLYALPTLYLCFVFIWEQTATCATYSVNWLVFITEMKSVYCAVRTGSLNKAVCASSLNGLRDRWRWVVNSTLWTLYLQRKLPDTHWIGGWVGPRARLDFSETFFSLPL